MQTNHQWENMLTQIKKRGRKKILIKKTLSTASLTLILLLGSLFFFRNNSPKKIPLANQTTTYEVALMMEDVGFYDEELGFISDY